MLSVIKAHAYGNDFLYVEDDAVGTADRVALARHMCARQTGLGADGLIFFTRLAGGGARMRLLNADGSRAEVSGNGVRALGAVLLDTASTAPSVGSEVVVETEAGEKRLTLLAREGKRYRFRASMGQPSDLREQVLDVGGESLAVVTLNVGNPQCIRLESPLDVARVHRLGPLIEHHPAFPEGTNVEFVQVDASDKLSILIWERGAGPTHASGTGACASAVAAAACGGAGRDVMVASPGGEQRVEWLEAGLFLTGWAEVLYRADWFPTIEPAVAK